MWKQKYENYNVEFNIRKNLKTKRPTEGYNTEEERAFAAWSNVSDWVLWHQNTIIGEIYKTTHYAGDWAYCSADGNIKGFAHFKGDAVRELWEMWRVENNKENRYAE